MSLAPSLAVHVPTAIAIPSSRQTQQYPGVGIQWFTNNGNFANPAIWYVRQLLTATRIAALAPLHRHRPEFAQELPDHGAVPFAVPNRLHQRLQPRPVNAPNMILGIGHGTDHKCPAPEEHTAGFETLLLKTKLV